MKNYHIEISVKIKQGNPGDYAPPQPIHFSITEGLPANVDAERYLRQRLAEELKRHFGSLVEPIDNKTDEVKASQDPLEAPLPF
jgi:hypothetical protein